MLVSEHDACKATLAEVSVSQAAGSLESMWAYTDEPPRFRSWRYQSTKNEITSIGLEK